MTTNIAYPRFEVMYDPRRHNWQIWALIDPANSRKIIDIVDVLTEAYDLIDRLKKAPIVVRRGSEKDDV